MIPRHFAEDQKRTINLLVNETASLGAQLDGSDEWQQGTAYVFYFVSVLMMFLFIENPDTGAQLEKPKTLSKDLMRLLKRTEEEWGELSRTLADVEKKEKAANENARDSVYPYSCHCFASL